MGTAPQPANVGDMHCGLWPAPRSKPGLSPALTSREDADQCVWGGVRPCLLTWLAGGAV